VEPADPARLADVASVLIRWTGSVPTVAARQVSAQVPSGAVVPRIVRQLDESGIDLAAFSMRKSSLDEVFLTLTGSRADEERSRPGRPGAALAEAAEGRTA
jgi:oleandomycin transport system ATP-binding protein